MDHRQARQFLDKLIQGGEFPAAAAEIAAGSARLLLQSCRESAFNPNLPAFQLICRLTTASEPGLAAAATTELYREVIEPLCDDFSLAESEQAHQVLAGLISYLAETSQGKALAASLRDSGLLAPPQMLEHWQRATSPADFPPRSTINRLEKVLIPSRITAGADVAITSVLVARLRRRLPGAEVVLVGPPHLRELFAGLAGVRHLDFTISRQGALAERLLYWPPLLAATAGELAASPPDRVLVLDPDSRLTQLGLLPLAAGIGVCQFPSQSLGETDERQSLSSLANTWLDRLLGEDEPAFPFVSPPAAITTAASAFCARLRQPTSRRLLLVNLGVGGNDRKRLPEDFEYLLLSRLLELKNTTIILDTGCGSEEKGRADKLLRRLNGAKAPNLTWRPPGMVMPGPGIVGLCSSLGELAATCGAVDGYLGYDSCGQHLANGAGTPGVTIFAGHPSQRFLARWSPWNRKATSKVIAVDPNETGPAGLKATIDRALTALNHLTAPR